MVKLSSMVKQCQKCKETKPLGDFPKCKANKDGYYSYCKTCNSKKGTIHYQYNLEKKKTYQRDRYKEYTRAKNLVDKYGLTVETYNQMLQEQNNKCAICSKESDKTLVVDHCHTTGKVRSLLCFRCNTAIGFMLDNPEVCLSAAEYLTKHKDKIG